MPNYACGQDVRLGDIVIYRHGVVVWTGEIIRIVMTNHKALAYVVEVLKHNSLAEHEVIASDLLTLERRCEGSNCVNGQTVDDLTPKPGRRGEQVAILQARVDALEKEVRGVVEILAKGITDAQRDALLF